MNYVRLQGRLGDRWLDMDLLKTLREDTQVDVGIVFLALSLMPSRADTTVFDTFYFREIDGTLTYKVPESTTRYVMVPAFGQSHYCLTILDTMIRVLYTIDSFPALGLSHEAYEAVRRVLPAVQHQIVLCPRQRNDFDCAIWTLTAAHTFLQGGEAFDAAPVSVNRRSVYEFVTKEMKRRPREYLNFEVVHL